MMNGSLGSVRWLFAGGVSIVAHVVVLGTLLAFNRPSSPTLPSAPSEEKDSSSASASSSAPIAAAETKPSSASPSQESILKDIRDEPPVASAPAKPVAKPSPRKVTQHRAEPPKPVSSSAQSGSMADVGVKFDDHATKVAGTSKPAKEVEVVRGEAARTSAAKGRFYVVKPGDTLTKIVRETGISAPELAKLNGIKMQRLINLKVGQKLRLSK